MIQYCIEEEKDGSPRFTTKGAFGDTGSLNVDEDDDEDWPFLKSLQTPCFSMDKQLPH